MKVSELAEKIKSIPGEHDVTGMKVTRGELSTDGQTQEVTMTIYHKTPDDKGRRTMFVFPLPARLAEGEKPLKHRPFGALKSLIG